MHYERENQPPEPCRAMATAGVGAPQLAGQIYRSALDDSAAARLSADFLGARLRADFCDRDDIACAVVRYLCISHDQDLLHDCANTDGTFARKPIGAAIHGESNARDGRRDLFVSVPDRDGLCPGIPAVHRKERYLRHYKRRNLRLPADWRRVGLCLRSRRTAPSRFVQRRTLPEADGQHGAAPRLASHLHLLQLCVPDDDGFRRYPACLRGRPKPVGDGGGVRPIVYGYSDRAAGRSRDRTIDERGGLARCPDFRLGCFRSRRAASAARDAISIIPSAGLHSSRLEFALLRASWSR